VDTGENRPMTEREAGIEIMMQLPEQFLELVSVFLDANGETYIFIFFSLEQGGQKNLKPFAHDQKVPI
jgi:hypothetical protein